MAATKTAARQQTNTGGITWAAVTANGNLVANTGTLANKASLLTLTLPTTSAVGDIIEVAGMNAGLWKVTQNASQKIHFGVRDSTIGTSGSIQSSFTYDAVKLICVVANLEWSVIGSTGTIQIN